MKTMKQTYEAPQAEIFAYELSAIMDATVIQGTADDFEGDDDWTNRMDWHNDEGFEE